MYLLFFNPSGLLSAGPSPAPAHSICSQLHFPIPAPLLRPALPCHRLLPAVLPQDPRKKFVDTPRRDFYRLAVRARIHPKLMQTLLRIFRLTAQPPQHRAAVLQLLRQMAVFHLQSCRRFRQLQQPRIIILGQLDPLCQGLPSAAPVHLPYIAYVGLYSL